MIGAEEPRTGIVDLTVVCVAGAFVGDLAAIHREFREQVAATGLGAEFLYVIDGHRPEADEGLARIVEPHYAVRVFRMARGFGRASCLRFAFSRARGRFVVTIPDRFQVEPSGMHGVLDRLRAGDEVVVTRREPRADPWLNRLQSRVFHALVRNLARRSFRDMTCELRGFRAEVARRLDLYGDLHRFIPILAVRAGYKVSEVPVGQRREDQALRFFLPGVYARRLLDVLHVFFLTRFTRKPLRFFGLLGLGLGAVGAAITGALGVLRLLGKTSLTDRPLLLLGVLLLVLGVQIISIGLIGEIVIFLSARQEEPDVTELRRDDLGDPAPVAGDRRRP